MRAGKFAAPLPKEAVKAWYLIRELAHRLKCKFRQG